jgi:glycosyltransferase involved in cell wall biosynthesis
MGAFNKKIDFADGLSSMSEKKVLVIAYYFPPLGMGGVQRTAKFVKYLPQFGWKPYVLTVKDVEYMAKDDSLLNEIPPQVRIVRTGSFDPLRIVFLTKRALGRTAKKNAVTNSGGRSLGFSWLFFPDNKVGWVPFAVRKALSLCRREKIDLIFSSSPPPSAHLAAYLVKHATGIPWVADFRDPWIGYKLERPPTPLHLFLKGRLEKTIVSYADRIVTANPVIQTELTNAGPQTTRIRLIDQGYDEEDFREIVSTEPDIFTVGYLGTLSPDCDPQPVFRALGELISKNLLPRDKVKFLHVGGSVHLDVRRLAGEYGLSNILETKGYLPHRQALAQIAEASVLLLITSDDARVFPAKVFEYLRLGKPILGIVPEESQIAKSLQAVNARAVTTMDDAEGIKQALLACFAESRNREMRSDVRDDRVERFERKALTGRLASLFNEVTSA